ncbi:MAG: hypothetical protein HKN90_02105 [Flavobacteriaceae bacterium]|nr:hypothetical protein [Flavobacteriaceae bacterium]
MKKSFWSGLLFTSILLFIVGCSTKKDAFLNRGFHSLTTKYNVLYNGQVAFDQAKQQIDDEYNDNFWEILPIEPLKIEEEKIEIAALPGQRKEITDENTSGFEKAELKAIKAVQKHSMDINGRERNMQIDDAYLLLGKARYYSQRFVPALEAFNFILGSYVEPSLLNETRVWQAKTLIRLQNEKLAIETLSILVKNDNAPLNIIEDAHVGMAQAYQSLDSTHLVIKHLDSAVFFSVNPKQKARNLFILGQLYRQQQKIDSSNLAFEELINFKKAPYRYKIHAEIDRAKNYSETDSTELVLKNLYKLIKDRDNRPYLDELYYQTGLIELANENDSIAIDNFNKSLRAADSKLYQQELTFEALGNVYFDKAQFKLAGSYYDSVLNIAENQNNRRIRRLIRKRKSLDDVILFENIAQASDSILYIASLNEEDQSKYFQDHIATLKAEAEEAKRREEAQALNTGFGNLTNDSSKDSNTGSKFYFYSVRVTGFGQQEFKKVWGNRPLEDNWRLSDKTVIDIGALNENTIAQNTIDDSRKFDLNYYLDRIPREKEIIDSIKTKRNDAYFQLGLSYKEQFKEYQLAANRLEKLLSFPPEENLILPIKYHLYKIYENIDAVRSNKYKDDIVTDYPDSNYATLILNPEEVLSFTNEENTPEGVYYNVYCDYEYEHYDRALENTEKALKQFEDLPIIPKFELLKAYLLLKTQGKEAYREALNFVALKFPNSEEGKHALEILSGFDKNDKTTNKNNSIEEKSLNTPQVKKN